MEIVVIPDSYKKSLSVTEVTQAIERGSRGVFPDTQYVSVSVADSDERAVEATIITTQGSKHSTQITGPLDEKVNTCWDISGGGKTTFTEAAAASGLALVPPEKRNPPVTASRGTGELILQAPDSGTRNTIIGTGGNMIGGGGMGVVQALGAKLCDANGTGIGYGGGSLMSLNSIDISGLDPRLKTCSIHVVCDVTNPLVGDPGASRIFGPQKGVMEERVLGPDCNLLHYTDIIKKSLRIDMKDVPDPGAAGGIGAALMAFLGAELYSGIRVMTQALNLEEHIYGCTLVVTGEGRIDSQSIHGKVSVGMANVTKKYYKPVIGIGGSLTRDVEIVYQYGIDAVFSILTSIDTLEEAFRGIFDNICRTSRNIATTLTVGMCNTG